MLLIKNGTIYTMEESEPIKADILVDMGKIVKIAEKIQLNNDMELFDELGTIEATWHMDLDKLGPFVVDIDCQGNNLYKNHEKEDSDSLWFHLSDCRSGYRRNRS